MPSRERSVNGVAHYECECCGWWRDAPKFETDYGLSATCVYCRVLSEPPLGPGEVRSDSYIADAMFACEGGRRLTRAGVQRIRVAAEAKLKRRAASLGLKGPEAFSP